MTQKQTIQEGDIVICVVKKIEGTTVFLEIENSKGNLQGSIIFSEVSAGRIRNIREFVVPNKRIVCKVLRVRGEHIDLTLRRVTGKEKEEALEKEKKEKTLISILKPVLKEKTQEVVSKISEKYELSDFVETVRENPKILEEFITKAQTEQLAPIFTEKKEKEKEVKRGIYLKSLSESGLYDLQEALKTTEAEIYYDGSSKFVITTKAKDFKIANQKLDSVIEKIKEKAKKLHLQFEAK